jgi:hypothetical protein
MCLYLACAMPPSSRKSRVVKLATEPLMDYMHDQVLTWETAPKEYRGKDPRVMMAGDATQEGLGMRLGATGGRCTIVDAEGDWLDIMAGRYGDNPSMGVALKGWGAEPYDVTRAGRADIHLASITVSAVLAVQPDVLDELGAQPRAHARGLVPRLLVSAPPRMRARRGPGIDPAVIEGWSRLTRSMAATYWGLPGVSEVRLNHEAYEMLQDYAERVEDRIEDDMVHLASWAGKSVGTAARIAGVIHAGEHIAVGWQQPIGATSMAAGIAWVEYFAAWALICYPTGPDERLRRLKPLATWLLSARPATFSRREAARAMRPVVQVAADLQEHIDLLVEQGVLEVVEETNPGATNQKGIKWARYRILHHDELALFA